MLPQTPVFQLKTDKSRLTSFSGVTLGLAFSVLGPHYRTMSQFLGFMRILLGSRFPFFAEYRQGHTWVLVFGFLQGPARPPCFSFPVFVGSHQGPRCWFSWFLEGPARVPLRSWVSVFRYWQGPTRVPQVSRVSVFRFLWGPARIPLGSQVQVFQYAIVEHICRKSEYTF